MVISPSLARLLTGVPGIVQHPAKAKVYPIHLGCALSLFLFIIHIWWWGEERSGKARAIDPVNRLQRRTP
ncbi:hypothetical protein GGE46_000445 [Rhizobium etli]|uniref:Uncharacterized protein n=1 Tax=Rhizobium etli TaxID=29449 RepID=A0A7W6V709_RHIET|nr:hypothetical protein [Rhizobium etli]MBB4533736.1 hypothetical protein [Rhizobium etli]